MSADDAHSLSRDTIFDVLSSRRRRFVLEYLRSESEPGNLTEIATAMAASEADTTPEQLESHERKRAYVSLYQTHIPRLADEGVVTYDPDTGRVALSSSTDEVLQYLDVARESDLDSASEIVRLYPLLAGFGLCVYVLVVFGGVPISPTIAGVAILATLFFVSGTHWAYVERPFDT